MSQNDESLEGTAKRSSKGAFDNECNRASETDKETTAVPEEKVVTQKKESSLTIPNKVKDEFLVEEKKDIDNGRVTDYSVPALEPKLSATDATAVLDFIPPEPAVRQLTPPRPANEATVVQRVDPSNTKHHYQIKWEPRPATGHPPHNGYSPVPYYQQPFSPTTQYAMYDANPPYSVPYYPSYPHYYPQEYQSGYSQISPHAAAYHSPYPHAPYYPSGVGHTPPRGYPYFPSDTHETQKSPLHAVDVERPVNVGATPRKSRDSASSDKKVGPDEQVAGTKQDSQSPAISPDNANTPDSQNHEAVNVQRLQCYTKPTPPTKPEVTERKERKNQMSRTRAEQRKREIDVIESKPLELRTPEEQSALERFIRHRERKNNRSRERAIEKKEEIERIQAKPEAERTKIEKSFLEQALSAKKRKNEGDRLRRERLKQLGITKSNPMGKPGVSARGPLPSNLEGQMSGGSFDKRYTLSPPYSPGGVYYPRSVAHYTPPGYSQYQYPSPFAYYGQGLEQSKSSFGYIPPPPPPPTLPSEPAVPSSETAPNKESVDNV